MPTSFSRYTLRDSTLSCGVWPLATTEPASMYPRSAADSSMSRTSPPHSGTGTSSHLRSTAWLICCLPKSAMLLCSSAASGVGELGLARDLERDGPLHLVVVRELVAVGRDEAREVPRVLVDGAGEDHDLVVARSEEHTSELQSRRDLVCRLLLEKKKKKKRK